MEKNTYREVNVNTLTVTRAALCLMALLWLVAPIAVCADFPIRKYAGNDRAPAVAYNSTTHEYLVVWVEGSGQLLCPLMGQRISETGAVVGSPITIANLVFDTTAVSVAYNKAQNEFLVTYVSGILPDYAIYGQRLSASGVKIGSAVGLMGMADRPKVLYNSLAGNYLLVGLKGDLYSRKIGADGQPLGDSQNLTNDPVHDYTRYAAAYGPVVTSETPQGRYLVVKYPVAPIMLDSDGKPINTMYQPSTGQYWPEIHFFLANEVGGMYNIEVAYGDTTWYSPSGKSFLIVWADNNNTFQGQEWTGIWGGYVDAVKLDYKTTDVVQDLSFPISAIASHWAYSAYAETWKPVVAFNPVARKFQVVWRETPGSNPLNNATVPHIRGNTGFFSKPPSFTSNVVLSAIGGTEDPRTPAIAASVTSSASLVVWNDSRNLGATGHDIYGALYPIMKTTSTPLGTNVQVDFDGDAALKFDNVTVAGISTCSASLSPPVPPLAQQPVPLTIGSTSADIATTASFTGNVEVWLQYEGSGLSGNAELQTTLRVFDTGLNAWVDITSKRDAGANRVYGVTTHLSTFAVMVPVSPGLLVTNTGDSGPGSLRQALIDANATTGPDSIAFAIPLSDPGYTPSRGVWTITPLSYLPPLQGGGILLDGHSQQVYAGNTNPAGPEIELDGTLAGTAAHGLRISSAWNQVRGLVINRFPKSGIYISDVPIGANLITSCYVGVTPDAKAKAPNKHAGIYILNSSLNFIGFLDTSSANVIGGNGMAGIVISDTSLFNVVSVNCIGTDFSHTVDLGNYGDGVVISGGAKDNAITGFAYPMHVVVRNNGGAGVRVSGQGSIRNLIAAGNISDNGGAGIVLESGGNLMKPAPVITKVNANSVEGTAAPKSMIFIYCDPADEGEEYRGTTYTNAQGKFWWDGTVKGPHVTAIAVDTTKGETTNNTSPFSAPFVLTGIGEMNDGGLPAHFGLSPNYPNPFNPNTVVSYQLPVASQVKLVVYDLLGREVAVLVDAQMPAGEYRATFHGALQASGIYVVRLKAGAFTASRKMLLAK